MEQTPQMRPSPTLKHIQKLHETIRSGTQQHPRPAVGTLVPARKCQRADVVVHVLRRSRQLDRGETTTVPRRRHRHAPTNRGRSFCSTEASPARTLAWARRDTVGHPTWPLEYPPSCDTHIFIHLQVCCLSTLAGTSIDPLAHQTRKSARAGQQPPWDPATQFNRSVARTAYRPASSSALTGWGPTIRI